jgi:hypothetical protein
VLHSIATLSVVNQATSHSTRRCDCVLQHCVANHHGKAGCLTAHRTAPRSRSDGIDDNASTQSVPRSQAHCARYFGSTAPRFRKMTQRMLSVAIQAGAFSLGWPALALVPAFSASAAYPSSLAARWCLKSSRSCHPSTHEHHVRAYSRPTRRQRVREPSASGLCWCAARL